MNEQRLTEDQIAKLAGRVLRRIKPLANAREKLAAPESCSSLIADDCAGAPYKPSQAARRLLCAATEHLDALHALMMIARVHHPGTPFTLVRAAIETAATATWLLTPAARSARVHRTLRLALQDAKDQNRLERAHTMPTSRPFDERRARIAHGQPDSKCLTSSADRGSRLRDGHS